jgi:hypothetical protein
MDFLGVWEGSYIVKNIHDFMNFLGKVEQCSTFEGKITKIQFRVVKNNYAILIGFLDLWVVWAKKLTLEAKFGGYAQKRGMASLAKKEAGEL